MAWKVRPLLPYVRPRISDPQSAAPVEFAGSGQVGLINQPLPSPLVVRVEDEQGLALAGITVVRTVARTSAVQRVLGGTAGEQMTTATVDGLPPVVFTSTAGAGSVPQLNIATQPSSAAVNGERLVQQPVVQIDDGAARRGRRRRRAGNCSRPHICCEARARSSRARRRTWRTALNSGS
jgi:hypothetical protein